MESLIDQDLYVLTMGQAVNHWYPTTNVVYEFIDRDKTIIEDKIRFRKFVLDQLDNLCSLRAKSFELDYLESLGYFKPPYLEFLRNYRFNPNELEFAIVDGQPRYRVKGLWKNTIFWEIPVLAINTMAYLQDSPTDIKARYEALMLKAQHMYGLNFCEFGTRRRRNFEYQDLAVQVLKDAPGFLGTSNPYLAMKHNVKCVGTMAHQWIMGASALVGVKDANKHALYLWMQFYEGKLGVALTDTYGTDNFLQNFDGILSRVYNGVRQDSGNPLVFADKVTKHYEKMDIDPSQKTISFSDGLTPLKAADIDHQLTTPAKRVYCIGTDFTNDQKLNLVMKLVEVDGKPVVKVPDEVGKTSGQAEAVAEAKRILNI